MDVLSQNLLGRAEENHENLSQNSWHPSRDSNRAPIDHKSRAFLLDQPVRYPDNTKS
jgi:hypothetical protein